MTTGAGKTERRQLGVQRVFPDRARCACFAKEKNMRRDEADQKPGSTNTCST